MGYQFQPIAMMGEQFNPMDSLAQTAQLQGAYQQNQLRAMQIAEMQRQQQEAQANRQALGASVYGPQSASTTMPSQSLGSMTENAPDGQPALTLPQRTYGANLQAGSDPSKYIAALSQSAPQLVPGVQAQMAKQQQEQQLAQQKALDEHNASVALTGKNTAEAGKFGADARKADFDTHTKQLDIFGNATGFLLSLPPEVAGPLYPQVVQSAGAAAKIPPEQIAAILQQHPTYDPAFVTSIQKATIASKDQITAQQAAATAAETARHNKATEDESKREHNMVNQREKDKLKQTNGVPYAQLPPDQQSLVDQIGQGKMAMNNLDRILTKNPGLMSAVAEKYPDFDSSKIKAYTQTVRDFTGAGKYSNQLNAGSTGLRHLAQLKKINDDNPVAVRTVGTKAYNAYHNLLDTVAAELVTFYGEPKTNETMANKKATLGALTNRDAAIEEQGKAMGEKFDELENTWLNAAPSKAYHSDLPGYSEEAKQARAKLDPEYAKRLQGSAQPVQGGQPMYATNPQTKQRIVSNDGGQTWQAAQ